VHDMQVRIRQVDLTNATWYHGSRYSYPLRSEDTGEAFALVDILKRQGTEPPPHVHHREHEIFVCLDTPVDFQASGSTFAAKPGAVAFLPSGIPHRFGIRQTWGRLLVIAVPGGFERYLAPFSVPATHLDTPPPAGDLDVPGLIARGPDFGIEFVPPDAELAAFPSHQPEGLAPIVREYSEGETLDVLGVTVRVKVSATESAGALSFFMTEDPPRVGPPLHVHHREDETFYAVEGEYAVQVGDRMSTLRQGQCAFLPRGVPHTYANAGASTGKLLVLTTPGGFDGFFREVDALSRATAPTPENVAPIGARYGLEIVGPPIFA